MQSDTSISRVKQTFEDWSLYETVIRHNYMRHQELVDGLATIISQSNNSRSIIDLGCGDAWLASHAFRNASLERYLAVDLSESAVERAKKNTAIWGQRANISCGNLAEFVANQPAQSANLVLASNSLHHFSSDAKATIIEHCFRILSTGGTFCWIDPVRNEEESRETYLRRLTDIMMHDWTALTEDGRKRATAHVWESDFPETESTMLQFSEQAGFKPNGRFLQDDLFGAWQFTKP